MNTTYAISEIAEIFDGPHATPTRQDRGPYFLNISSLKDGRLDLSQSDHVSDDDFSRWTRRVTPQYGDLLFSYETRLGEAALMPDGVSACLGRRMGLLRPNRKVVGPEYLLYYYLAPGFQKLIEQNTIHGATVNRIPLNSMGSWHVQLPPLPEQQAIAEVLGALDDKIAANTHLAATAEELAASIYSEAAREWPTLPMSSMLAPVLGGTPSRSRDEFWTAGDQLWISARDVTSAPNRVIDDTVEKITVLATHSTKAKPLPSGSVILTARGTVGAVGRLSRPASFNQSCYGFVPGRVPPSLLYFSILRATERAKAFAHGSVFDTITKSTFDHLDIAWDGQLAPAIERRLARQLQLVDVAINENRTLAAMRDALLPKLMSGALRVRDAQTTVLEVL